MIVHVHILLKIMSIHLNLSTKYKNKYCRIAISPTVLQRFWLSTQEHYIYDCSSRRLLFTGIPNHTLRLVQSYITHESSSEDKFASPKYLFLFVHSHPIHGASALNVHDHILRHGYLTSVSTHTCHHQELSQLLRGICIFDQAWFNLVLILDRNKDHLL